MFGDATRVLNAKQASISSMGRMPRNSTNPTSIQEQVEWLLKLELDLQDIFDIGQQDVSMERAAYNPMMVTTVTSLFPFDVQQDLAKFATSDSKETLQNIQDYIHSRIKWRCLMKFIE